MPEILGSIPCFCALLNIYIGIIAIEWMENQILFSDKEKIISKIVYIFRNIIDALQIPLCHNCNRVIEGGVG